MGRRLLTTRLPKFEGELVILKRESIASNINPDKTISPWVGRTESGEKIIVDSFRHDAQLFLSTAGFSRKMEYSNGS